MMEILPNNNEESLLDKVKFSRTKHFKQKYGRATLDLAIIEKALGEENTRVLMKRVKEREGLIQALGHRMKKPNQNYLNLFEKHLTYPGSMADLAREEHMTTPNLTRILHLVGYYQYVIERKQLALKPPQ